ncbi:MAG: PEP-utilizing enzyme [Candidatus Woesearchaeota archaeon]
MKKLLSGLGTSKGKVIGIVRVINNIEDHEKFNENDILVTRLTDPTMVPIMAKAGGIICDIGGLTSHPSIVSREMGIPCIVAANNATEILKDGDKIHMCGKSGDIHKIDEQNEEMNNIGPSQEWNLKCK